MTRNGLYLRSIMAHLGLSRPEVAAICDVSPRTVGNWLSDRNEIPGATWPALARVHHMIHAFTKLVLEDWRRAGEPKLFEVTVPPWSLEGARYIAAWNVLEALEAEHVHVILRPSIDPLA